MLLMAFVGGFILNCSSAVLPVALIVVFDYQGQETRRQIFIECQTYSIGVLMSFGTCGMRLSSEIMLDILLMGISVSVP